MNEKGSQPKTRTKETFKPPKVFIYSGDREIDRTWRRIRQIDRELVENMPEQHVEPLLIREETPKTGRYGTFMDLMEKGPDENFVRSLAKLLPVPKKKAHKMVMTDGYGMVKEEVDTMDEKVV